MLRAHRRRGLTLRRRRSGMTLAEVIVAMTILITVLLVLGAFSVTFAQASGQAHLVIAANEIAAARLDAARTQATYGAVDTLARTDSVRTELTTYKWRTEVRRIGGAPTDTVDYKLVTVTVTHPGMRKVVTKTTAVSAF